MKFRDNASPYREVRLLSRGSGRTTAVDGGDTGPFASDVEKVETCFATSEFGFRVSDVLLVGLSKICWSVAVKPPPGSRGDVSGELTCASECVRPRGSMSELVESLPSGMLDVEPTRGDYRY